MTGYKAVHDQLARTRGRAAEHVCVDCGETAAEWSLSAEAQARPDVLVDPRNGAFSLDLDDYAPRCWTCHRALDRRETCFSGRHPWPASAVSNGEWVTCRECRRESNHEAYVRRRDARPQPEPEPEDADPWHPEVPCVA